MSDWLFVACGFLGMTGFVVAVAGLMERAFPCPMLHRAGRRCGRCGRTTHRSGTPGIVVDVHHGPKRG